MSGRSARRRRKEATYLKPATLVYSETLCKLMAKHGITRDTLGADGCETLIRLLASDGECGFDRTWDELIMWVLEDDDPRSRTLTIVRAGIDVDREARWGW